MSKVDDGVFQSIGALINAIVGCTCNAETLIAATLTLDRKA